MPVVNWKKSPYHVYIGRHVPNGPSNVLPESCIYGNPFKLKDEEDPEERAYVIAEYEKWLLSKERVAFVAMARTELPGKVLGCWCKPKDCHGDVLLWVVNASTEDIEMRRQALGLEPKFMNSPPSTTSATGDQSAWFGHLSRLR